MTKIFILIGAAIASVLALFGIVSKKSETKAYIKLSNEEIDSNNEEIKKLEQEKQQITVKKTNAKKRVEEKKKIVAELEQAKTQPIKRNNPAKQNLKSDIINKTRRTKK
jgi:hypothetical protein